MSDLLQRIRSAVANDRYVVGVHALDQLDERGIEEWQAIEGLAKGRLHRERPRAKPNAVVEIEQLLADGTPVKAVWSWIEVQQIAKLVTVHFLDR